MGEVVLMQGNEACVEGAIAAGMRLYAGYPITPSTEIAERSAVRFQNAGEKLEGSGLAAPALTCESNCFTLANLK